ncbi:hypothetical protein NQ314_001028 [Rhamnusium bicolor]|uniref:Uncharacterized protein n=1 Tax=Rhamnusium bicolor TaxID=1586634 RepID=A0AAV8ZVC1_9CUCU|nr:hypothetical protein NQ314_001028 [Rhamnusium bicolor]
MDVTFTNVLEGARQYFQGLPAGTSSTAGPAYSAEGHHRNDSEQNQEMPPSSNSYWPPQPTEPSGPPTREHTPVQRPPSHNSDSSRPPSHSQYIQNVPMEQNRIHYPGSYQEQYPISQQQQQHHQQQSFQFPRPQSREVPSNHSQYQSHIPTSSPYHQTPSPYHQIPSPQLPRAPSRDQMVPRVPSREQPVPRVPSREQLLPRAPSREQIASQYPQASENYNNYSQSRSYFPVQSQPKSVPSNNTYKSTTTNQSYSTTSQQQSAYYKHIYSSQPQPSHQSMYVDTSNMQQPEVNQHHNTHPTSVTNDNTDQGRIRTTHNLPPIAALSNYHSSRSAREPTRPVSSSNSRTRPFSTSSYTTNTSQQNSTVTSNSSIIQQNPVRSQPYPTVSNYQDYRSYTTQPHQQQYQQTTTVTTQAYNQVIMTTSNSPSYYSTPSQIQSSSQSYYQSIKSNTQNISRSQSSAVVPAIQQPQQNSMDNNLNGRLVMKRESPLDLSVKTVRTPADSTLGDAENEARNKYYQSNRTAHSTISTHNYPQLDVNSLRRNITQRSAQLPSATAPKVEFRPNFNVPSLTQPPKPTKRPTEDPKRGILPEKAHSNNKIMYDNKNIPYQSSNTNRYPTVSIPSAAHVNSYIQSQQVPPKNQLTNVSRMDFPAQSQKTNSLYAIPSHDVPKKRPADVAPSILPP